MTIRHVPGAKASCGRSCRLARVAVAAVSRFAELVQGGDWLGQGCMRKTWLNAPAHTADRASRWVM
jgi:hypothetical protein